MRTWLHTYTTYSIGAGVCSAILPVTQRRLDAHNGKQRERLVGAMRDVERLLVAPGVQIRPVDPEDRDAQYCLAEYVAELNWR